MTTFTKAQIAHDEKMRRNASEARPMTARRRPTGNELFHDDPSPAHPVCYSSASGNEPDRWLSVNDAVHRLYRVLDIPAKEQHRYPFARQLSEGARIPTMFATYSIPEQYR